MLRRLLFRVVLWLSRRLLPSEVRAQFSAAGLPQFPAPGLPPNGIVCVTANSGGVYLWADPCGVAFTAAGAEHVAGVLSKAAKMVRFGPLAGRGVSVRPDVSPRQ